MADKILYKTKWLTLIDRDGYIMVKEDWGSFRRYEYITRTCLGEMTGEIFIDQALKFVDACSRPNRSTAQ